MTAIVLSTSPVPFSRHRPVGQCRCYDKTIRTLSQANIIKAFGKPDLEADSTTESMIGYKVSGDKGCEW